MVDLIILTKKTWVIPELINISIIAQLREKQVHALRTKNPQLFTTKVTEPEEILTFYKTTAATEWNMTVN